MSIVRWGWGGGGVIARYRLTASDYRGPDSWRWRLVDAHGQSTDHQVTLDTADWQYQAARDLRGFVAEHARGSLEEEARIVEAVGNWVGDRILGELGPLMVQYRPAVVTVTLPDSTDDLAIMPLELARIHGKHLSLHNVTMVTAGAEDPDLLPVPVSDSPPTRLRVLAVFQTRPDDPGLDQRKERHAFEQMVKGIAASTGMAIDFRALQYRSHVGPAE